MLPNQIEAIIIALVISGALELIGRVLKTVNHVL